MAKFGAYQVHHACRHAFGHLEMELVPGRYEPQSGEELEAMAHLADVPVPQGADGSPGVPFAVKLEDPDGAPMGETGVVRPGVMPNLAEPPAAAEAPVVAKPSTPPAAAPAPSAPVAKPSTTTVEE